MTDLNIAVLLSAGVHPVSGKARMAPGDARGVEMALRMNANCTALHVGNISNPALRDYAGLGLDRIEVLGLLEEGADVVFPLVKRLAELKPDIVLTGLRSENGEASGMVPYQLAQQLGLKHVASICAIESINGDEAIIVQGYKGFPRHKLAVKLPALFSVGELASPPRMHAFAKARHGKLEQIPITAEPDEEAASWSRSPARRRPKKIATGQSSGGGKALVDLPPDEAAARIASFLKEIGIMEGTEQ